MNKPAFSKPILTALIISLSLPNFSFSRALFDQDVMAQQDYAAKLQAVGDPLVEIRVHRIGRIGLTVSNQGHFGNGFVDNATDPKTGEAAPSCEYPVFSGIEYLFAAAFWVGAIVGRDTLVTVGADGWFSTKEFWPPDSISAAFNGELMTCRSINDGSDFFSPLAKSELDVTCVYYDTLVDGVIQDARDGRPHKPLNIKIRQTSYSWSYDYADDFVLFDYEITNIDPIRTLERVYMGIYVDGDVLHSNTTSGFQDDITGFRLDVPALSLVPTSCKFRDTINLAWLADNNGFDEGEGPGSYGVTDPVGVTGTRVIRTPAKDTLDISFNWWISNGSPPLDWGPRIKENLRELGGFLGTPEGDRNKYHFLSNGEFDYDQLFSAVNHESEGWLPPDNLQGCTFARGFDTRYLLSFGPFIVFPGETLPLTFAYVGGDKFHITSGNRWSTFSCVEPQSYYDSLSFKEVGENAQWASWIYDNPGVDTDGDGEFGDARFCPTGGFVIVPDTFFNPNDPDIIDSIVDDTVLIADTIFYRGDGVPDFNGANPPAAPDLNAYGPDSVKIGKRVVASPGQLTIEWNGLKSETVPDNFSNELDFEGYRVLLGESNKSRDLVMQASYDRENFAIFFFDATVGAGGSFVVGANRPLSVRELQIRFAAGNPDYDPSLNDFDNPLSLRDTTWYFVPLDANVDDLTDTLGIHKIYPNAPYPHTLPGVGLLVENAFAFGLDTFWVSQAGDTTFYPNGELTPDGIGFQYFEYRYVLRGLLPSRLYFVAATAFDFGAPRSGIGSLESNPLSNRVAEYPQNRNSVIAANDLKVIVYPNPYRIDGEYRDKGFEGRNITSGDVKPEFLTRRINFTNLPPICTIRIFSIDGDLISEINHNFSENEPQSMHDAWDLITRNRQQASSGIYYYVVEEPAGEIQIGKLVLIM